MSHTLCPQLTLPTRFSKINGTLIDNIFCKSLNPIRENCSGILINTFSDHQPCFMLLNIKTNKAIYTKLGTINQLTQKALLNVKNDLMKIDMYGKLDQSPTADVNFNYDILQNEIRRAIDKHMVKKTVKFNKHKHNGSNWITQGGIQSIRYRDKLYRTLKTTPHDSDLHKYTNKLEII